MTWKKYWENKSIGKKIIDFGRKNYFAEAISKHFNSKDKIVLEAGCGSCESLLYIVKHAKVVIGLDISKKALELAEESFKKVETTNHKLILGDIFNIPFKDNTFDITFNAGVIEHFKSLTPIKEMIRVTKKKGKVVIFVPAKYSLFNLMFKFMKNSFEDTWEYHKFYTKKMLEQELIGAGAKNIHVEQPINLLGVYMMGIIEK